MSGSLDWQHPFVDVFKQFSVFELASVQAKGQVSVEQVQIYFNKTIPKQDNSIGRRIIKLQGAISSNNSITIPEQNTKQLGLTGRYIYVEFYVTNGKYFTLHFDVSIRGRDIPIRLTISNLYENYKVQQNQLQIPYPKTSKEKWTILILDLQYFLSNFGLLPHSKYQNFCEIHTLKSIQICSTMNIKGIYTSDQLYDWDSMPKQLLFKLPKGVTWSDAYQIAYWPSKEKQPQIEKQEMRDITSEILQNLQNIKLPNQILDRQLPQKSAHQQQQQQQQQEQKPQSKSTQLEELVKKRPGDNILHTKSIDAADHPLQPYPIMSLDRVLGFTVRNCPDIKWGRQSWAQGQVVYAAGAILIINDLNKGKQNFLMGHSSQVSCLDVSKDGSWIASGQQGRNAVIRIWDYSKQECLSGFATPYVELTTINFSSDKKMLVTSGQDDKSRQILIVWGLEGIPATRKPSLIAKQSATSNIISIKFSPIDNNRLVSCGHENIKFWRIKNGHLPGSYVVLDHHARNNTFAVLDFEYAYQEMLGGMKRVYFGSKNGVLLQVSYATQQLEAVFQVHNQPISALCISAGFCVTGSKDQFLRVWPLDFSEFYIEARHEGIITSLDISLDGLQVICGTSTGGLGVLDISAHSYRTIIRSHTSRIIQLEVHELSGLIVSLSEDCTIRLWDINKNEQIYEFTFPQDDSCTILSTHPKGMYFAAGFKTGVFRVFDIENTSILNEGRYHENEINHLTFNPSGSLLCVSDSKNIYRIYDTERNYSPIKTLDQFLASEYNCAQFSVDGEILATIGDSGAHVNLWDCRSWTLLLKIFIPNTQLKKIQWAWNNVELVCGCKDGKIKIYGIERELGVIHAYFLREQSQTHRGTINSLTISQNLKFIISVGGDQLVKVWDFEFSLKGPGSSQVLIGHQNGINSVCMKGTQVMTAGGDEGIFVWNFHGDLTAFQRTIDFGNHQQILQTFGRTQNQMQQPQFQIKESQQAEIQKANEDELLLDDQNLDEVELIQYNQNDNEQQQQQQQQQQEQQQVLQIQSLARKENPQQNQSFEQYTNQNQSRYKAHRLGQDFQEETISYRRTLIQQQSQQKDHYSFDNISGLFKQYQPQQSIISQKIVLDTPIQLLGSQECHDNLIWCQVEGWIAWTVKNFVIFDMVSPKNRNQKILEFDYAVGVLAIDPQQKYLLVGCSCIDNNINQAPINVINSKTFEIEKQLIFHTRGVQQMKFSDDGKFLVTIGNMRECTVIVWEWPSGKLLGNSYTLDKLNEVNISRYKFDDDRLLEFSTVGRDQVLFWALTKDGSLEYYDYFMERNKNTQQLEEITSHCYVYLDRSFQKQNKTEHIVSKEKRELKFLRKDNAPQIKQQIQQQQLNLIDPMNILQVLILGLQSGEMAILTYGDFKMINRWRMCSGEITGILINQSAETMIIMSTDSVLVQVDLRGVQTLEQLVLVLGGHHKFNDEFPLKRIRLPGIPISFAFDQIIQQGVVSFKGGQLSFINLHQSFIANLCSTMKNIKIVILANNIIVTIENDRLIKLWNSETCEYIDEWLMESKIQCCFYDQHMRNIVIFLLGQIAIISIDRIDLCEIYQNSGKQFDDVQINGGSVGTFEFGLPLKLLIGANDCLYTYEQIFKGTEYQIRLKKALQFMNIQSLVMQQEKKIMHLIEQNTGIVNTISVDNKSEKEVSWGFTLIDVYDFKSNPHGDLDQNEEQIEQSKSLYAEMKLNTQVVSSSGYESVYFAILNGLQYVYCRNYNTQQIILQIGLSDFPLCIVPRGKGINLKLFIGMKQSFEIVDPTQEQNNVKFYTHLGENMKNIIIFQDNVLCIGDEGGNLYRLK